MIRLINGQEYERMINSRNYEKAQMNYISLQEPSNLHILLKKIPRTFEITTNNGSCHFNTLIISEISVTIRRFINQNKNAVSEYHLDISNNNGLKKIEEICQGNITYFDEDELADYQEVIDLLMIQNCPDFMENGNLVVMSPDFEFLLTKQFSNNIIISTALHDYECNMFGICSSKVLQEFITANPDSKKYSYDYNDEFNEFQQICDFFNFGKISITTANIDFLKEISEELKIDIITNRIRHIDGNQEKIMERIEDNQKTVEKIDQLFEWLYQIKVLSVEKVKNLIIESKWSKTEENVQEMVAFILQVIKNDDILHLDLMELLIKLDSENSNELKILLPFLKDKLLKEIDRERYYCEFVYRLYHKGLFTKEDLFPKLKEFAKKTIQNAQIIYLWFLPEMIEFGCLDEQNHNKNESKWGGTSSISSFIQSYYPDNMDLYKKMRDSFKPNDEITRALRIDDVDTFQSIISSRNIKNISKCFIPSNIFDTFSTSNINYLNYSAAFGSIKCFKYLMLNHLKIDQQTFYFALHGGNIEIIKIVDNQQSQIKNDNQQIKKWTKSQSSSNMDIAKILLKLIKKQRNDLFDWIFEQKIANYDTISNSLGEIIVSSVRNGNAHALVSIINKGFNIFDYQEHGSLQSFAALNGFYHLLKFLNKIEGGKTYDDLWGNNLNYNYVSYGNLNIFKFYVKAITNENSIAAVVKPTILLDNSKMYNYFFDQQSDKITHSIISMALLHSLGKKTHDLFYLLIEKFKKVCPLIFKKFEWNMSLLNAACQHGQIEPFYTIINLIDKTKNPNFTDCIREAASSNEIEICKYLIDNKYNINYVELFQELSKVSKVNSEIIVLLFNSSGLECDKTLFLPLLSSAIKHNNKNFVEFLIERGIFYDECLIDAVSGKNIDIVNTILKYNSSPKFINRSSPCGTALHIATKSSLKILQRLLAIPSINPYLYDANNKTPLMIAVDAMDFQMIKEIISFSGENIVYHQESIDYLLKMLFNGSPSNKSTYNYDNYKYSYYTNYGFSRVSNTKSKNEDIIGILEMLLNIPNIQMVFNDKNQKYFPDYCSMKNVDIKIVQLLLKVSTIDINYISVSRGETALTSAVKTAKIDIIKLLINDPRINCNITNAKNESPLNIAVINNSLEVVKLLLSVPSTNPYLYDRDSKTSLMIASNIMNLPIINEIISFSGKNIIYHRESVDLLLDKLVNAISAHKQDNNSWGSIKSKNNTNIYTDNDAIITLQMLLSIDNIQMIFDEKNQQFFVNICSNKNIDIKLVQIFLKFDKFNVNVVSTKNGNTPLIAALKEERKDVAELLINDLRTDINMTNYAHESALIIAAQKQYIDIVKLLINHPRFDPLESRADYAFIISKNEISNILLSMNLFDVNCITIDSQIKRNNNCWGCSYYYSTSFKSEETALIQAAKSSNLPQFEYIIKHPTFDKNKSKLKKAIELLMTSIKKDNVRDFLNILKDNNLIYDFFNDTESFKQLLKFGDIEIIKEIFECKFGSFVVTDELIKELFFCSLKVSQYSLNILEYLINYDKKHNNAIDFKNESFLLNIKNSKIGPNYFEYVINATENIVKLLVENGYDVNKPDIYGTFPLEYAISNNNYALVHALIKTQKVDFNQKIANETKDTYLHLAAYSRDSNILKAFIELKIIDVNVKNANNETPLMFACKKLLYKNVKILFANDNLDFHCKNNINEDALQIVQNINTNESDIWDNSNDSLTKEQYLSTLISIISEKRLLDHMEYDEDSDNIGGNYNYIEKKPSIFIKS